MPTPTYDLYFWTTPNGYKPLLLLEELAADYRIVPVNIGKDEQFAPAFLAISPNNRIPALVDHAPAGGGEQSVFESGAILIYLAEKHGRFLPTTRAGRTEALEWLMWQMGGLGPMAGQAHHFLTAAPEKVPYAIGRYVKECQRLYGVLDRRLAGREYLAGDEYSIADMASWPWVWRHERHQVSLDDFPNVKAWYARIAARPAMRRASERGAAVNPGVPALLPPA